MFNKKEFASLSSHLTVAGIEFKAPMSDTPTTNNDKKTENILKEGRSKCKDRDGKRGVDMWEE